MKQYYKYTAMLLLVAFAAASFYIFKTGIAGQQTTKRIARNAGPLLPVKTKPDVVPEGTMSKIQQGLVQREYHITFDSQKQSLQSPNRKQNLRAYYKPGVLTVQNRKDSAGHNFKLKLVNEGIYADGVKIHSVEPDASLENNENQLDINHAGFTEQYINNEEGVRQNFIVGSAPKGTSELQVRLSTKGLKVNDVGGNELHFYNENQEGVIERQLVYKDLKCWDAAGQELTASLTCKEQKILISVNASDAVYPITIDPIVTNGNPGNANSTAESNQAGANAGYSVASAGDVNGDGYSDALVGAPYYDKGETNEGAVLVYYGSATGLGANPVLILESNQAEARFGSSVSTAGNVNKDGFSDVVIGAPYYDKGQTNEGAAFIYHGSVNGLAGNAVTVLESNQVEAHLGNSVSLAGDVNADGFSDVIVGAPWYDKGQTDEGAAFVYHGSAAGVIVNAKITLESNQVAAKMGNAVAGAGDVNGDGYSDVVVGSFWYDKGQNNEGAAFIYHGGAWGINANAVSVLESNQADAVLGFSVASAGDVNGDGYSDVVVGAYLYDNGQVNEGAAFVYHGSAAGINVNAANQLEVNQAEAQAGYSVASAGDVNGDGYSDVIVGANTYDKGESNEGGAFIYHGSATGLSPNAASVLESNQVNASLGMSVASAGDVNGDGYSDIIAGAPLYDKGELDEGVAFVWQGIANGIVKPAITIEVHQQGGLLGMAVSTAGDINGDGYGDVIIGAPNYDSGQAAEGVAFVFYGSVNGLNMQPVKLENNFTFAHFGAAVSSAGDANGDGYGDILVGAPYQSQNSDKDEGAVYIFYGSLDGIKNDLFKQINGTGKGGVFGISTSCAGDVNNDGFSDIIVGAIWFTGGQYKEGAAFIYYGSGAGINEVNAQKIESDQSYSEWGTSVSGAGDLNGDGFDDIAIGALAYINSEFSQIPQGAVFVFYGSAAGINLGSYIKLRVDQNYAHFGSEVSGAGDVNGDGYVDLIVGAPQYDNSEVNEGAVFVYYGSQAGVNPNHFLKIENNFSEELFGNSLAGAGDLNGDGYGDIIVGATGFGNNSQTNERAVYIYYGSNLGFNVASKVILEANQSHAALGWSVSSAGDINGDGYGEVIVGAPYYDNGQLDEGAAFVYYGNSGFNLKNNLRLYNSNLTTPINHNQFAQNNFGAGLYAKSFLGRSKGKLVWETKAKGEGFSKGANNVITNSTQSNGSQNVYASLGLTGTELKSVIAKQGPATKVRVRVKFDPTTALTGQTYGPWRYLPAYLTGSSIAPVPEDAMAETVKRKGELSIKGNFEETISIYPNPVSDKLFIGSKSPEQIRSMQLLTSNGKSVYKSSGLERTVDVRNLESGVYILILTHSDGSQVSKKVMIRK